jgi:hypothetical protein
LHTDSDSGEEKKKKDLKSCMNNKSEDKPKKKCGINFDVDEDEGTDLAKRR